MRISDIVDLERYPIAEADGPQARPVIDDCHRQLAAQGLCLLPGFVRPDALAAMVEEGRRLAPEAHHTEHWRASPHGAGGPGDGVIPRQTRASVAAVAYDRIAADSPLRRLYEWDGLTAFIARALNDASLTRCADPLVSCMLTVFRAGDELGWHYDPNDGVVSLLLQAPAAGGAFEFAPGVRCAGPDATAVEAAVMDGRHDGVVRPALVPGALSLFRGRGSLHRVAPVDGETPRIIALFNYSGQPGYVFGDHIHRNFFGRGLPPTP